MFAGERWSIKHEGYLRAGSQGLDHKGNVIGDSTKYDVYDPKRKRGEAAGVADSHKKGSPLDKESTLVHVIFLLGDANR